MNCIEWHGNGVVVIRERSVLQMVWRFFTNAERKLYSAIRGSFKLSKAFVARCSSYIEGVIENYSSSHSAAKTKEQTSVMDCEPVSVETKHQPRPMGTLTEIRRYAESTHGNVGEQNGLQQLLPALAGFCQDRWLVLVSPPQRPDSAELMAAGIDPSRVLLVHARDSADINGDTLNANGLRIVEQALQSGTCGAVVAWLEECNTPTLQRLRQSAVQGHAWGVMFREGGNKQAVALSS